MTSASMNRYAPGLVDSFERVLLLSYPSLTPTMQLHNCSVSPALTSGWLWICA